MNMQAVTTVGITLAALWAAHKFGSPEVKGMALGVAGFMLVNQIPVVRDGVGVQLMGTTAAA